MPEPPCIPFERLEQYDILLLNHSSSDFGMQSGYVPKNAHDITPLVKSIGISTSSGIVIADPTNLANSAITVVPDLSETDKKPVASLKARVQGAKPLGLVRFDASELLVIYDGEVFHLTFQRHELTCGCSAGMLHHQAWPA